MLPRPHIALWPLTRPHLHVPRDDTTHRIAGNTAIDRIVHILVVGGRGEWHQDERSVTQDTSHSMDLGHRRAIRVHPVDRRLRTSGGRAVQPAAGGVRELHTTGWLHHESGTAQVGFERFTAGIIWKVKNIIGKK